MIGAKGRADVAFGLPSRTARSSFLALKKMRVAEEKAEEEPEAPASKSKRPRKKS